MATYETTLSIPRPPVETFAFVSDFRNAVRWDPRTYAAEKTTDGPIGVGTRFVLSGGLLPEARLERLHLPRRLFAMSLPYDVTAFDPPHGFVLVGETRTLRYRDELTFQADGEHTCLRYMAALEAKVLTRLWEPLLERMFARIGHGATRGLPSAVLGGVDTSG